MLMIIKKGLIVGMIYLSFLGYLLLFCDRIERLENHKIPLINENK